VSAITVSVEDRVTPRLAALQSKLAKPSAAAMSAGVEVRQLLRQHFMARGGRGVLGVKTNYWARAARRGGRQISARV
jgi:hypothetical protein